MSSASRGVYPRISVREGLAIHLRDSLVRKPRLEVPPYFQRTRIYGPENGALASVLSRALSTPQRQGRVSAKTRGCPRSTQARSCSSQVPDGAQSVSTLP